MKIFMKKFSILLLFIVLFSSLFSNPVKAIETKSININQELTLKLATGDEYNSKMGNVIDNKWEDGSEASGKVSNVIKTMVVVVKVVAVAIAIIMLLVLAMKYMTSAPGEKAEIKKYAVVYVVGAVVLFGATGILTLIEKFSRAFSTSS